MKKRFRPAGYQPTMPAGRRFGIWSVFAALAGTLLLSACTTYRPLDRGARVPWAAALSEKSGGPIDGDLYRVGQGDALSRIADRYNVRLTTLAAANNIEAPYVLYPGEVLRIPGERSTPSERPAEVQTAVSQAEPQPSAEAPPQNQSQTSPEAEAARSAPTAAPVTDGTSYVVAQGESLAVIAVRHGLTLGEMVAANNIEPPYQIRPGQSLIIPVKERPRSRQQAGEQLQAERVAPLSPPPPLSADGFIWPVEGQLIGSFEDNSVNGRSGGVTIAARKGTPVRAADNGVVAYAGEALSGYGRMVMLRHDDGYVTLYAHNDVVLVQEGDVVYRGQSIAEVGDSGDVESSQLHFELRKGTAPIDPSKLLAGLPERRIGQL